MQLRNFCLAIGFFTASSAFADAKQFYAERKMMHTMLLDTSIVQTQNYQQKTDHFSEEDTRTFKQRYYVDSSLASGPNAPVFFYICGESTCQSSVLSSGLIRKLAEEHHAHLVALEHRYYGLSQPFADLSTEHLKFLSTEQAIEDLASFQRSFAKQNKLTGKWIALGGSYPGSLSAYYRSKHPELVIGSLASSAPVKAKEDFSEYDAHITKVAGDACADKMRSVVSYAESILNDESALVTLKNSFGASDVKDKIDFLYVIADVGAFAVQYGMRDEFCNKLTSSSNTVTAYGSFAKSIFSRFGLTAVSLTAQSAESLDPASYLSAFGMRQWLYQSCTEYGYWQNASQEQGTSVRSSKINLNYHRGLCKRLFGQTTPVNTNKINEHFFKPLLGPETSSIVFTNGEQDPWSNLSISTDDPADSDIKLSVIAGGAHCDDLASPRSTDSTSLKAARLVFTTELKKWFKKR